MPMRFVVLRHVRERTINDLRWSRAEFAERIGIPFDQLLARARSNDPSIALVDSSVAKRIDDAIGCVASFECPAEGQTSAVEARNIEFERFEAFVQRTGMSISTFARIVGLERETIVRRMNTRMGWGRLTRSAPLVELLLRSNEQPDYERPDENEEVFVMPSLRTGHRRCQIPIGSVISTKRPEDHAPKWRKILHVLIELSLRGAQSVDESDLIVATWRQWPSEFGLRGYTEVFPEAREVRSKLVSSPLCDYVERDPENGHAWRPLVCGLVLVDKQRHRKRLQSKLSDPAPLPTCPAMPLNLCAVMERDKPSILPSLRQIERDVEPAPTRLTPRRKSPLSSWITAKRTE